MTDHTDPYTYVDPDKNTVTVRPGDGTTFLALDSRTADGEEHVTAIVFTRELDEFVTALYEASGRPAPIILDAPDPKYAYRAGTGFGDLDVDGQMVRLTTSCDHCPEDSVRSVSPHAARAIGAVLAALGKRAVAEPDPAEVARLITFLHEVEDTAPVELARSLFRRFEIKERAS